MLILFSLTAVSKKSDELILGTVLQVGHWTYECKGERKYVQRSSRTEILKRKIEGAEDKAAAKVKKEDAG